MGGYQLTPIGGGKYSVELRDRIFDADKVVDPIHGGAKKGGKPGCEQ